MKISFLSSLRQLIFTQNTIVNKEKEYMSKEFWYEQWDTILQNIVVHIYAITNHCNEWFWQDDTIWGYMCPEMIIRDVEFINSHVAWWPIILLERQSWEIWDDVVTNEHLVKCVKACLTVIQVAKHQNSMETRQCKYCFSSIQENEGIKMCWNLHMW